MNECAVRAAASVTPDAPALVWKGETWSYAHLDGVIEQTANVLKQQGILPGARLPIRSSNSPEMVVLFHALYRLKAVFMPLHVRLTDAEVATYLRSSEAKKPARAEVRVSLFTSGTTGVPRLVDITEGNLRASAAANAANLGGEAGQRWLGTLPLFHIGGIALVHRCAVYGACVVLEPQFDAVTAAARFDEGVTHASLVPTTLERLLEARGTRPFSQVKGVLIGGGPMTSSLLKRARDAGLPVVQTYGLTEATSQVCTERLGEADGHSAGRPVEGVSVRLVDEQGVEVATGTPGEIQVSGPTVTQPGWLSTKDLGQLDERGRLTVLSRRVDLIVSGGENIYPLEVEAALREHPLVSDVAVVPAVDDHWGQVPVAFVVLRDVASDDELATWLKERLAAFKVPKQWHRLDELPRNAMGKLERSVLVDRLR